MTSRKEGEGEGVRQSVTVGHKGNKGQSLTVTAKSS